MTDRGAGGHNAGLACRKLQLSLSNSKGISVPGGVPGAKRMTLDRSFAPLYSSCFCSSKRWVP